MGNYRDNKIYFPGGVYHFYNRGVNKGDIYLDDQDYRNFLYRFLLVLGLVPPRPRSAKDGLQVRALPLGSFEIISYCLMPNHFHFIIKQLGDVSPEKLFRKVLTSYVRYFNLKHERVGHLFQDIFKYKPVLDDAYLLHLTAYVHRNPDQFLQWKHSSLSHFLGLQTDPLVSNSLVVGILNDAKISYKDFLDSGYSPDMLVEANLLFEEDD